VLSINELIIFECSVCSFLISFHDVSAQGREIAYEVKQDRITSKCDQHCEPSSKSLKLIVYISYK